MNVYIPLDGWTLAVMVGFTLLALWWREWKGLAFLWGAFIAAAVVHQLIK